ncbi:hypothetical protein O1611_g4819 [Lasiodiplodia mahajangana]|uniref:Uncharacterized protein n=1 Tax=Lasiodiplodia mahajangana TaxID=1108764 RepID=A0ACC2JN87_9PEZI|nr:hypothetical protein O1611_g4819 [Lasiodiplodia mahajangana]
MADSYLPAMAPQNTVEGAVPEQSAMATSEAGHSVAAPFHDDEPTEFILSSNWVLWTEGVKDFYEALYRRGGNFEIRYDPTLHAFRIKCLSKDDVKVVALVKDILDEILERENNSGLEASTKVINLEDWRKMTRQPGDETKVPNKYLFPRDVAICNIQETWNMPTELSDKGITTGRMFPESVLSELQHLTDAVLVPGSNGNTVYIGASRADKAVRVKQKLDTLARLLLSTQNDMAQVIRIFLYNEGDRSAVGEYRFLADGNDRLLRSYVLDRLDWPYPELRYPVIFKNGVTVRLNPDNEPWDETRSISNTILPIIKTGSGKEEFDAFKLNNWTYASKEPVSNPVPLESDACTIQSGPHLTDHQSVLRPKIENWVSGLPIPRENEPGLALRTGKPIDVEARNSDPPSSRAPCSPTQQLQSELSNISIRTQKSDPFEHLWKEFRETATTKTIQKNDEDTSDNRDVQASRPVEERKPLFTRDHESGCRSFHVTMNQKAGSRTVPSSIFPDFHPDMMVYITKSLECLLDPVRMWPGFVDFKIDIGRFCFLDVKPPRIQRPGDDDDEKHFKLDRIQNELNKRHSTNDSLHFTRVLTTLGADANYIARISNKNGSPMWHRPIDGRSSIYQFTCRSRTVNGTDLDFTVDINTTNFTTRVKQFKPNQNCFAVYCTKRAWDFQIVLSVSQDLNDVCGRFVEDLVHSLRVMRKNDRIPELEVSYDKNYGIEILAVRTRNTACCVSEASIKDIDSTRPGPQKDLQRLYISEVLEMDRLTRVEGRQHIHLKFVRYKNNDEDHGVPLKWYEVALRSDALSTAFQQNEKLELGDETKWTPEELHKSGAVEGLIRKATDMVKNMDGIGYWNDNHQGELLRRVAPVAKSAKGQNPLKFW